MAQQLIERADARNELNNFLDRQSGGVFFVLGESGVGKSKFMELSEKSLQADTISSFVDLKEEGGSSGGYEYPFLPFNLALSKLLEKLDTEIESKSKLQKFTKTLEKILKEEKNNFFKVFLYEVVNVARSQVGKDAGKEFWRFLKKVTEDYEKEIREIEKLKGTLKLDATPYIDSFIRFLEILRGMSDKQFVFLIDQAEIMDASFFRILSDIYYRKPDMAYFIVSYMTEGNLLKYDQFIKTKIDEHSTEIKPFNEKEIGDFLYSRKSVKPSRIAIQKIQKITAGLPIVIDAWESSSKELNPEEIPKGGKVKQLTELYKWHLAQLGQDSRPFAFKASVLRHSLKPLHYEKLLGVTENEVINIYEELKMKRVFGEGNWFKHDLIKTTIDKSYDKDLKQDFHKKALTYFEKLSKNNGIGDEEKLEFKLDCCHHSFNASLNEEEHLGNALEFNSGCAIELYNKGRLIESEECFKRAIECSEKLKDPYSLLANRGNLANVYNTWGMVDSALATYSEILKISKKYKIPEFEAAVLHQIAMIHQDKGEYDEALKLYNESMELEKKLGDQGGIASTLGQIANIHHDKGEYDEALELYNEVKEVFKKLGDQSGIAKALHQIANVHYVKGEYDEALKLYNEGLEIKKKLGDQSGIAVTLHQIAMIHQRKGEYDEAIKLYNEGLEINKKLGDQSGIATTLHQIAMIHQRKGEYDEALKLYNESLEIRKELGDQMGIAYSLAQISLFYMEIKNFKKAQESIKEAIPIFEKLGNESDTERAKNQLKEIEAML